MSTVALSLKKISKNYGNKSIFTNINLEILKGRVFGLLGPNGSGKTTLIRLVNRILLPTSGEIRIFGEKLDSQNLQFISYLPEERGLWGNMKVYDQLDFLARLKGLTGVQSEKVIYSWLDKFDIRSWKDKKIQSLSKGMQQKIQFIATLLNDPEIIILDEPFTGLDPVNTNLIKKEINNLQEKGKTIIFSTHRMEQVEEICDDVTLINQGKILINDTLINIKNKFKENLFRVEFSGNPQAVVMAGNFKVVNFGSNFWHFVLNSNQSPRNLLRFLLDNNVEVSKFEEILPNLNQIFLKIVN